MTWTYDSGLPSPMRTLVRNAVIAKLAPLTRAGGGWLEAVIPIGFSIKGPHDELGIDLLWQELGGRTPALAVATTQAPAGRWRRAGHQPRTPDLRAVPGVEPPPRCDGGPDRGRRRRNRKQGGRSGPRRRARAGVDVPARRRPGRRARGGGSAVRRGGRDRRRRRQDDLAADLARLAHSRRRPTARQRPEADRAAHHASSPPATNRRRGTSWSTATCSARPSVPSSLAGRQSTWSAGCSVGLSSLRAPVVQTARRLSRWALQLRVLQRGGRARRLPACRASAQKNLTTPIALPLHARLELPLL